jgi:hypothetical protein
MVVVDNNVSAGSCDLSGGECNDCAPDISED